MSFSFPSAILLAGDPYLTEERYQALWRDVQSKIKGEIHAQSFRLNEVPLDIPLSQTRTLPFLAAFQIFKIQEAHQLKEKKLEPLADYLDKPAPTTLLVFLTAGIEKNHSLVKLIEKKGQVIFLEDFQKKIAGAKLVCERLRGAGKVFAPGALERLEEQAGDAPSFMDSVMDQLLLYAGDQKEITQEMVETFQENWKEPNIFLLIDAVLARQRQEALVCLKQILDHDERELIPLIGLLHWQIRRFWQAKVLLEEGVPQSEIMRQCKIYPKQAPFFWRKLQKISRAKLETALESLFQLDWGIKSGQAQGAVGIEQWVVEVTA